MFRAYTIFFSTIGCIIGWGAFLAPEMLMLPKFGVINSILGIIIGSILICIIASSLSINYQNFFLTWFLILGYLCISSLNLINIFILIEDYFHISIPYHLKKMLEIGITLLCLFLYLKNQKLLNILYRYISTIFFFLLFCIACGLLYILIFWRIDIEPIAFANIDYKQIIKVVSITPWFFIGFSYALMTTYRYKVSLTVLAILFSSLLYLSILICIGLSNAKTIWDITNQYFGFLGKIILFLTILLSIMSGFLGFILLVLNSKTRIYSKTHTTIFYLLSLLTLSSLGTKSLNLLITIVSMVFSLSFFMDTYHGFKNKKNLFTLISVICSSIVFLTSLLPQNTELYNHTTLSILTLWLLTGAFLRYNQKKKH